ncbi:MAG: OmpA family protein [Nitrospiraceae bacterium]
MGGQPLPEERVAAAPLPEILPLETPSSSSRFSERLSNRSPAPILLDALFDFDQHTLRRDAIGAIESNARRLKEDDAKRVLLEGRGDEVGTSSYNLVLGERRALGVKRYLENLGFTASVIEITSYGKDRPLCTQHNPECWQKNRSVHFSVKE